MTRIVIGVDQIGETTKCQVGCWVESRETRPAEVKIVQNMQEVFRVMMDEMGGLEESCLLDTPSPEMLERIRKRFTMR